MPVIRGGAYLLEKTFAVGALWRRYLLQVPSIGLAAATVIFLCEASARRPLAQMVNRFAAERVKVRPARYDYPLHFRRIGTDTAVVQQMLVRREYEPVSELRDVRLILDCGANIGVSAYYLLHRYPNARLVAVEPDVENSRICRENLAPFGDRAIVIQAAVWPCERRLRIAPGSIAAGAWGFAVEEWSEGDIEGLPIPEILARAGVSGTIDLLKMDVENSEVAVFSMNTAWLETVRNIAIELHSPEGDASFTAALAPYRYGRRRADELTIIDGLHLAAPSPGLPTSSDV